MTIRTPVAEAKRRFSELLGRVQYAKERVVITKRGKAVAALVPLEDLPAEALVEQSDWLRDVYGMLADAPEVCDAIDEAYASRAEQMPRPVPGFEEVPAAGKSRRRRARTSAAR
jgi:prevent-host-death family protein